MNTLCAAGHDGGGGAQKTRLEEQGHLLLKDKSGVIGVTEMWPVQEIGCDITLPRCRA